MNHIMISGRVAFFILLGSLSADEAQLLPTPEAVTASNSPVNLELDPFLIPSSVSKIATKFYDGYQSFDIPAPVINTRSWFTDVIENIFFLCFSKPNLSSRFDAVSGLVITEALIAHDINLLLSPQAIQGKEYLYESKYRRFFQVQNEESFVQVIYNSGYGVNDARVVLVSYKFSF